MSDGKKQDNDSSGISEGYNTQADKTVPSVVETDQEHETKKLANHGQIVRFVNEHRPTFEELANR